MIHLLWGEWGWPRFWRDGHFIAEFAETDFPTVAALEARWRTLEQERQAFAEGLSEEQLGATRVVGIERSLRTRLLVSVGATVGGSAGWWLGAWAGTMTGFVVGILGTAVGGYLAKRWATDHLG